MHCLQQFVALLAALALATGCASLDAQVFVFDESQSDPMIVLFASLPQVEAHVAPSRTSEGQRVFLDTAQQLTTQYLEVGETKGFDMVMGRDRSTFVTSNREFFGDALRHREEALAKASVSLEKARRVPLERREAQRSEVLGNLRDAEQHFRTADGYVHDAITTFEDNLAALFVAYETQTVAKTSDGKRKLIELAQAKAEALRKLRGWVRAAGIGYLTRTDEYLADARTALVVGAPDVCWRAVYNQVYGGGKWGNVDVAVIKETATSSGKASVPGGRGLPEFSLKGVRVDAGTVSRATFAGIKEALNIAALAVGLPSAPISTGTTSAGTAATQPDAGQAEHERLRVRQEVLGAIDAWLLSGPILYTTGSPQPEIDAATARLRVALDPLRASPK